MVLPLAVDFRDLPTTTVVYWWVASDPGGAAVGSGVCVPGLGSPFRHWLPVLDQEGVLLGSADRCVRGLAGGEGATLDGCRSAGVVRSAGESRGAVYQPSVAWPRTPLSVPSSIGLSRRCASILTLRFRRSGLSTPRP